MKPHFLCKFLPSPVNTIAPRSAMYCPLRNVATRPPTLSCKTMMCKIFSAYNLWQWNVRQDQQRFKRGIIAHLLRSTREWQRIYYCIFWKLLCCLTIKIAFSFYKKFLLLRYFEAQVVKFRQIGLNFKNSNKEQCIFTWDLRALQHIKRIFLCRYEWHSRNTP